MAKNNRAYLRIERKNLIAISAILLLGALTLSLSSQITLTGSTPSPAGVYAGLVTTGGQPPDPTRDTILARDRGNVGIRLGAGVAPAAALDVGPQDSANEGGKVFFRGAGSNPYLYLEDYAGNFRIVTQDAAGESEKFRFSSGGNRFYWLGGLSPGDEYWIMAGGADEAVPNYALGFDPRTKTISPGPGWTLNGGGSKAWSGVFAGTGWSGSMFVPLGFTPTAASCAASQQSGWGSWCPLQCTYTFGPSYIVFNMTPLETGCCLGWCGIPDWYFDVIVIGQ